MFIKIHKIYCNLSFSKLFFTFAFCLAILSSFAQIDKYQFTSDFNRKLYKPAKFLHIGGYAHASIESFQIEGVQQDLHTSFDKIGLIFQLNIAKGLHLFNETEYNFLDDKFHFTNLFLSYRPVKGLGVRIGFINIPIGYFNRHHIIADKSFITEPKLTTDLLPVIYSDAGFGFYGTLGKELDCKFSYELNFIEGIGEQILYTPSANTEMQLSKNNELRLNDNNQNLMINGRFAFAEKDIFEMGVSFLSGKYSNTKADTVRNMQIYALDFMLQQNNLKIQSELALNVVDIPYNMEELYADQQWGTYIDLIYRAHSYKGKKRKKPLTIDIAFRLDYVDLSMGYFNRTREKITNEYYKVTGGVVFRPIPKTAIILNGSYQWFFDLLGNPAKRTSGFELGIASYF